MENKKLHAMVEALINEDVEVASAELHEYLNETMRKVIETDDDKEIDDESGDKSESNECTCDDEDSDDEDSDDEDSDDEDKEKMDVE